MTNGTLFFFSIYENETYVFTSLADITDMQVILG
jgi:hypothetical protein